MYIIFYLRKQKGIVNNEMFIKLPEINILNVKQKNGIKVKSDQNTTFRRQM